MTPENTVRPRSEQSGRDNSAGELFVVVVLATLPADAAALSIAGVLPESVSLFALSPLWGVLVAATGLAFGAVVAHNQSKPVDERNAGRVALAGVALAAPALAANVVLAAGGYLFTHVLFSGTGYAVAYLYGWYGA